MIFQDHQCRHTTKGATIGDSTTVIQNQVTHTTQGAHIGDSRAVTQSQGMQLLTVLRRYEPFDNHILRDNTIFQTTVVLIIRTVTFGWIVSTTLDPFLSMSLGFRNVVPANADIRLGPRANQIRRCSF
jgi:hypothetical protein